MKKAFVFILAMVLTFCSCGSATERTEYNTDEVDSSETTETEEIENEVLHAEHLADYSGSSDIRSYVNHTMDEENGVYYDLFPRNAMKMLIEYNPDTGVVRYLCDDEECSHASTDCPAFVDSSLAALTYSDSKLYWVESKMEVSEDGKLLYKYDYTVWCRDIESGVTVELSSIDGGSIDYSYIVGFYKGSVILISGGSVYKAGVSSGEMSRLCDITFLEDSDYILYAFMNESKLYIIPVYYTDDDAGKVSYTVQKCSVDLDSGTADEPELITQEPIVSYVDSRSVSFVLHILNTVYFDDESFVFAMVTDEIIEFYSCGYNDDEFTELGFIDFSDYLTVSDLPELYGTYFDFESNAIYFSCNQGNSMKLTGLSLANSDDDSTEVMSVDMPDFNEFRSDNILIKKYESDNFLVFGTLSDASDASQQGKIVLVSAESRETTLQVSDTVSLWVK